MITTKSFLMQWIRDMWEKSMKGLLSLVKKSTPSSFTYICEKNGNNLIDKVKTILISTLYFENFVGFDIFQHSDGWIGVLCSWNVGFRSFRLWPWWRKKVSFTRWRGTLESQLYLELLVKLSDVCLLMFLPTLLQLAWTCYNFYQSTPTKLAGENYFFTAGQVG